MNNLTEIASRVAVLRSTIKEQHRLLAEVSAPYSERIQSLCDVLRKAEQEHMSATSGLKAGDVIVGPGGKRAVIIDFVNYLPLPLQADGLPGVGHIGLRATPLKANGKPGKGTVGYAVQHATRVS